MTRQKIKQVWETPGLALGQPSGPSSPALVPLGCLLHTRLCPKPRASRAARSTLCLTAPSTPISSNQYIMAEEVHRCAAPSREVSACNPLISPSLGYLVLLSLLKQSCVAVLMCNRLKYSSAIAVVLIPDFFK